MTAVDAAKMVGWLSIAFMCASIGGAALDVRVSLNAIQKDVHSTAEHLTKELVTLDAGTNDVSTAAVATLKQFGYTAVQTRKTIAKLNPSLDQLRADLEEGYSVEHDARLGLDNVNKAAIDERFYFERDLPPLMASIQKDVDDAGDTLAAGKMLLADPNLHRIIANSGDMTDSGRSILKDGADEVHSFTHPTKKRGFIAGFEASGDVAKHWMPSLF
jgi:hypothetical protein